MASLLQLPFLRGFALMANRLIVIDAGSHSIKILLVEKAGRDLRILRRELINLQEERLLSPEEVRRVLKPLLKSIGEYPVALALPQQMPLSQMLDLSAGTDGINQLIEAETLKNRDLRDSAIVYNYAPLKPFGRHQNSYWVTLCKEADIYNQISRLSIAPEDICEVVPSANMLAVAYQKIDPAPTPTVLVDLGASSTLVSILVNGQLVHATTFPIGGNLITETIATKNSISVDAAEALKQSKNLYSGPDASPAITSVIDGWRTEVERVVNDWLRDNPEIEIKASAFRAVLSGGGALETGLLDYINRNAVLKFSGWPTQTNGVSPQFVIAYGAALQTLGCAPPSVSLLPTSLRAEWNRQRIQQRFLVATTFLVAVGFFALAFGTWQKFSLIHHKKELLEQTTTAMKKAELMQTLDEEIGAKYERIRPVLHRQQNTLDLLTTLQLLEKSRTNRSLWYVLFADQQSYLAGKTVVPTNAPSTNELSPPKAGFIAELCLKEEGEAMRTTLGQVVAELKQSPLFSSVDTLPVDLRKDLADPRVLVPDRHFALSLQLADETFQTAAAGKTAFVTNAVSALPAGMRVTERSNPLPGNF